MSSIKEQRTKLIIAIVFFTIFILVVVRPSGIGHQVKDAYHGRIIAQKFTGHDTYDLIIQNQIRKDTIALIGWKRDSCHVLIGDSIAKSANSNDIRVYARGCSDSSCAISLGLRAPIF